LNEKTPRIKICGLFREEDTDYANESMPDYIGFVFAPGRRQLNARDAARLRRRLDDRIIPVGVFVNHRIEDIASFFRNGLIGAAQLHGEENGEYIMRLRACCDIPLIKAVRAGEGGSGPEGPPVPPGADCYLFDSGAGSGRTFNWELLDKFTGPGSGFVTGTSKIQNAPGINSIFGFLNPASAIGGRPWFLAGGIGLANIDAALDTGCSGVDISSGAESGGVKDREKMAALVKAVRNYRGI
jgi:phosphoribosylanthranilate isomerase